MKDHSSVSFRQSQLQAAAAALARCPDTPDWLKQVVLDALADPAKIAPGTESAQSQDHSFFYPH